MLSDVMKSGRLLATCHHGAMARGGTKGLSALDAHAAFADGPAAPDDYEHPGEPTVDEMLMWSEQLMLASSHTFTDEMEAEIRRAHADLSYLPAAGGRLDGRSKFPVWIASRRSLEYALAIRLGLSPEEARQMYATSSYGQLVQIVRENGGHIDASSIERLLRMSHPSHGTAWSQDCAGGLADVPVIKNAGPGALSGDPMAYTRKELCALLGYPQREAADLSDDELRDMAWAGGMIPRYKGGLSHVELALRHARNAFSHRSELKRGESGQMAHEDQTRLGFDRYNENGKLVRKARETNLVKQLRINMRAPYEQLARKVHPQYGIGSMDPSNLSDVEIAEQAAGQFLPGVEARALLTDHHLAHQLTARLAGGTTQARPDEQLLYRPQGAIDRPQTRTERKWSDAAKNFTSAFGDSGLTKLHSYAAGGWRERTRGFYRNWGVYYPHSGELALNPKLEKMLHRAEKATDPERWEKRSEISYASQTLAHELIHAVSGGGKRRESAKKNSYEHTLEEGATEALARLRTDQMARELGLWQDERNLRESLPPSRRNDTYRSQVATMLMIADACTREGEHPVDPNTSFAALGHCLKYLAQLIDNGGPLDWL